MKQLFLILSLLISGKTYTELLPNITHPQEIILIDIGHVIFVKEEYIFQTDLLTKNMQEIGKRQPNEFVGLTDNGQLQYCGIYHYMIQSRDEFSTIFKIREKEFKYFETIQPISWNGNILIARTALDFLEQHYYEINTDDGSIKEIPKPALLTNDYLYTYEDIWGNIYINYTPIRILKHQLDLVLKPWLLDIYQIQYRLNLKFQPLRELIGK